MSTSRQDNTDGLQLRVIHALTDEDPLCARMRNKGALEEELWTEDEWQDSYSDDLDAALAALKAEGIVEETEAAGMPVYYLAQAGEA